MIYLWYERQPAAALRLIEGLKKRYPHNPALYLKLAEVQADYLRDHAAALRTYRELYEAARASRVAEPSVAQFNARLGIAREMDVLCEYVRRDRSAARRDRAAAVGGTLLGARTR